MCFKDRKAPPRPCEPRGAPLAAALPLAHAAAEPLTDPNASGAARVANLNDNPDTKFDEHRIYSFLPKYMKLECNADGTVTKLTYNDASCSGPEVDDQTVTTQLIQAMVRAVSRHMLHAHALIGAVWAVGAALGRDPGRDALPAAAERRHDPVAVEQPAP